MLNTTPRLDEKSQALATERISAAQSGALAKILPQRDSSTRYQNPSLSHTLNIFPETKHYFILRNNFLLWQSIIKQTKIPRKLLLTSTTTISGSTSISSKPTPTPSTLPPYSLRDALLSTHSSITYLSLTGITSSPIKHRAFTSNCN